MSAFEFIDLGTGDYTLITPDGGLVIDAGRVRWIGDDLIGEVTITTETAAVGPLALTFMKPTSRRDVLGALAGHLPIARDSTLMSR